MFPHLIPIGLIWGGINDPICIDRPYSNIYAICNYFVNNFVKMSYAHNFAGIFRMYAF